MLTTNGTLIYGVEYPAGSGQLHHEFELRLPTIGDNVAAIETHGSESNIKLNVEMMARCLVSLGSVPTDHINYALLIDGLIDDDYDVLADARDTLKKKRMRSSEHSPTSAMPSSPSDATASASNA